MVFDKQVAEAGSIMLLQTCYFISFSSSDDDEEYHQPSQPHVMTAGNDGKSIEKWHFFHYVFVYNNIA